MNILSWFDNRTILACDALIASMFALVILYIHRTFPQVRGARPIAFAFILGAPSVALIAARGAIPDFFSVFVGNALIYVAYLLMFRGLYLYFGRHDLGLYRIACTVVFLACAIHLYYTVVDNRIVPRIILVATAVPLLRVITATALLRNASGMLHRKLFAAAICSLALFSFLRAPLTMRHGAPQNYMRQNPIQTYSLLWGVFCLSLDGIIFVTILTSEVTRSTSMRAQQDSLTGALNRRAIEEKLDEEISRGARTGRGLSVLLIDLDHFKTINDTRGHAAGDEALRNVVEAIASAIRPFDTLGRFGGDELLLLLPDIDTREVLPLVEQFRANLAALSANPTLSIGMAQSDPGESAPSVLARADAALYQAKRDGRNCIRFVASEAVHLAPAPAHLPR